MTNSNNQGTVLLVLDIQTKMMETSADAETLLTNVEKAVSAARSAGIPVVYAALAFRNGYPEIPSYQKAFTPIKESGSLYLETDPATGIHPRVAPLSGETVVFKKRYSAFAGNDLDIILRSMRAQHLIIAGYSTSGVVLSTVREAGDKDYRLTVLSDACADNDKEVHEVLMKKVLTRQAVITTTAEWVSTVAE